MEDYWLLAALLLPAIATGALAGWKRRAPLGWALAGFVFSVVPAPILMLLVLPRLCRECRQPLRQAQRAREPAAGQRVCATCRQVLPGQPAKRRILAWVAAAAVAMLVAVPATLAYLENSARSEASAFCARAVPGAPIAPLAKEAQNTGVKLLRLITAQRVTVGFVGVPPFSRYFCDVEASDGKVTRASVSRLD